MIPVLVGVLLLLFLAFRRWRLAAFTLFVICIESGTYRAASLVVHRDRPHVHRLESLPVNASFPSGHTAASVALLGGLLLVLASRIENAALRLPLWMLVVAIPAFVIWSRMLRGMHHATDVAAGVAHGHRCAPDYGLRRPRRGCCCGKARRHHNGRISFMKKVAVIAHAGKTIGGGLDELRSTLTRAGVDDPIWSEVPKSKYAPERVQRALDEGAELVFVWGGDGMVQRSIDRLAGTGVTLAIIPAGTANLFASSLDIPADIEHAVEIGLKGSDRTLDVGKINGERFAVMAGAGLDAHMIRDADGGLKDRFGRLAYIWTASKNIRAQPFKARIDVNDELWYRGTASCILLGNVGSLFGGDGGFRSR